MKKAKKTDIYLSIFCAIVFCLSLSVLNAQDTPKAQYPVLTTSAGQSTDVETLNIIAEEGGIGYDYCDVPTVEILGDGVGMGGRESADTGFHVEINTDLEAYPNGTPYKTIMFAIGASLKGMGAAGVSMGEELNRTEALIVEARSQGLTIVGAHVEGMDRRAQGAAPGDTSDEQSIDAVMPFADVMVIRQDGNADRRFTVISEAQGIPLVLFEKNMEMGDAFGSVFQK